MDIFEAPPAPPPSLSPSPSPHRTRSWASDSTTIDTVVAQAIVHGVRRERAKKEERTLRALWDHELHRGSLVHQATIANEWHRHLIEEANSKCFKDAIEREEHKRRVSIWGDRGKSKYLKLIQKEASKIVASEEGSMYSLQNAKDRIPTPYPFLKVQLTEPSLSPSRTSHSKDSIYKSVDSHKTASVSLPLADLSLKSDLDPENHNIVLAEIVRQAHIRKRKNKPSSKLSTRVSIV